ncbi:MAG: hypothetical protein ACRDQ9_13645 [Pseudonocardiaceae bacterium]
MTSFLNRGYAVRSIEVTDRPTHPNRPDQTADRLRPAKKITTIHPQLAPVFLATRATAGIWSARKAERLQTMSDVIDHLIKTNALRPPHGRPRPTTPRIHPAKIIPSPVLPVPWSPP